jgi:hypothetical protein
MPLNVQEGKWEAIAVYTPSTNRWVSLPGSEKYKDLGGRQYQFRVQKLSGSRKVKQVRRTSP